MTDTFQTAYDEKVREVAALNQMLHTAQAIIAYLKDTDDLAGDTYVIESADLSRLATIDYNDGEIIIT